MSVITPQHHRVGAHRARRNPIAVTVITVGAVVALSAILVWGLVQTGLIGGDDGSVAADSQDPLVGGGEATQGLVDQEPSVASSVQPLAPPVTTPTEAPVEQPPPPVVDQTVTITVLNGGVTVKGVAARTAEKLLAAGWTGVDIAATDNAPAKIPATIVAFADPALEATAQAVAASIGAGTPTLTSDYASGGIVTQLVVVLGPDFSEA